MITTRTVALGLFISSGFLGQLAQAEHTVIRQPGYVYRHHSLGANGAAVLTTAIQGAPAIIGAITPFFKEAEETKSTTKSVDMASCADLAQAQREANALLVRTANLVNNLPPAGTTTTTPNTPNPSGPRQPKPVGDRVTPSEQSQLGTNPWSINP